MELKEFIRLFAEEFDETPSEVFQPDTNYRELDEWSSLLRQSKNCSISSKISSYAHSPNCQCRFLI